MTKKIKLNIIGIFIIFNAMSCSTSISKPLGEWDDIIKLSQKEATLSAENSSILITTQGEWWWISDIEFDGTQIDFSDIDTTQNNFIIEKPEFKIERINKTEIHIEISKNTTDSVRVLYISLEAGDYFDSIKITQLSD